MRGREIDISLSDMKDWTPLERRSDTMKVTALHTGETMQLLGFNYKAAIGEPLTHLCANAIAGWGNKSNAQKRR